ncbi:77 kDa echinoderm microtubule-associated protein [Diplonema papillatum]|nr:77 kDa echinoderm microtubule-associated protein [Diplonema papillatum]
MQNDFAMTSRRHVFGMKADVRDNVHFIDDQTIAYPVGRTFVLYNQVTNTQKFIMGQERAQGITAMAITPNKKYIAVAACGDSPSIEIFDTTTRKRRKTLNLQDLGSKEFVCLSFSNDCRHLVTQGGGPEWNLVFWTWDRLKSVAMLSTAPEKDASRTDRGYVTCVSNNPSDPYHVCVSGNGVFKFFRFAEGQLKPAAGGMGKREPQNILCHRWLRDTPERVVASTDTGDLLLIENCEFKCVLPLSPSDGLSIDVIAAYSKGFICGGADGTIHVYEQSDEKELYRKTRTMKIESRRDSDAAQAAGSGQPEKEGPIIKSLSLSPQEEILAVATCHGTATAQASSGAPSLLSGQSTYGQLYSVNLASSESSKSDSLQPECLVAPFHTAPITGIDTCIRKPLIATCSKDHTIRIWNYVEHTLEICKTFPVEAMSIAMHPSGLHILVGFADKLRFMNLYGDDIKEFKSFNMRSCPECKFSHGGQYFAFVHGQVIQLYSTYTCEPVAPLRGPTGKIRCLYWLSPDDTRLLSAGNDGTVYDWNIKEGRKEGDHMMKSVQYTSVASNGSHPSGLLWAVGNDRKLREMEMGALNVVNEWEVGDYPLVALAYAANHKLLLAGCEDGSIRVISTPVQNGMHQAEHTIAHSSAISRICVTFDESILFTVGEDGCLWMFDIKERDGRVPSKREVTYAEEILISKADLEEKNTCIGDTKQKVDELKIEMDYLARKRDIKHEEKIKEMQDQFKEDSEKQWAKFEALLSLKQEQEIAFTEIRKETSEKHRREVTRLESDYQAKIQSAEELKGKLVKQLTSQKGSFEHQITSADQLYDKTRRELQDGYQESLNVERETCDGLRANERDLRMEHKEIRAQLEKDTDDEIEEIKDRYEKRLSTERDHFLQLKGENGIMRKKFTTLQKEIADKNDEITQLIDTLQMLGLKISRIEFDIETLKDEIKERDEMIGDKEKRIYELKKKNQELEKFKFVLDFKIRELKSQIEPRQDEITAAKQKIKEMDFDLEKYHQTNLSLYATIDELKRRIDVQQKEIHQLANRLKDSETYKNRVRTDLSELVQKIQEPKELSLAVATLYRKHVKSIVAKPQIVDEGLNTEYARQKEFLSRTVDSLKRKLMKDSDGHKGGASKVMNENVQLIKEINDLRKEIRNLRTSLAAEKHAQKNAGGTVGSFNMTGTSLGSSNTNGSKAAPSATDVAYKELEMQRTEIEKLVQRVADAEQALAQRTARPPSRDLPQLTPQPPSTPPS